MTLSRKASVFALLAVAAALTLTATGSIFAQTNSLYVEQDGVLSTNSQTPVPIAGLTFDIPAESAKQKFAIVTLDLTNLYLSGTPTAGQSLGGQVSVLLSGVTTVATGFISNDVTGGGREGRKSSVLVVKISLLSGPQSVEAEWNGVRNATINTDTFASMSAIMTQN
jgi:hypothetical protein